MDKQQRCRCVAIGRLCMRDTFRHLKENNRKKRVRTTCLDCEHIGKTYKTFKGPLKGLNSGHSAFSCSS